MPSSNCKQYLNCRKPCNRRKRFIKIKPRALKIALSNEARFVQAAVLEFICPSRSDDILSRRTSNQLPGVVPHYRLDLSIHSFLPLSPISPSHHVFVMYGSNRCCHLRKKCSKSSFVKISGFYKAR